MYYVYICVVDITLMFSNCLGHISFDPGDSDYDH